MTTLNGTLQVNTSGEAFIYEATSNCYITTRAVTGDEIIAQAKHILAKHYSKNKIFTSSAQARDFFITQLSNLTYEVFSIAFLTTNNKLIAYEPMFRGTLNETPIYVREVVKRALELNAASLILAHNHPSGDDPAPSTADLNTTQRLIQAFQLFEVSVLDHIIVSGGQAISLAESGLLPTSY